MAHQLEMFGIQGNREPITERFRSWDQKLRPSAGFKRFLQTAQGNRIPQGKLAAARPSQTDQMGADSKLFPDIVGKRAHVRAGRAHRMSGTSS